jgi:anti-sigma regulatory factor (Ser/Thr protein kinase)/CheY-like chemotaxis protein
LTKPNRILLLGHLADLAPAFESEKGGPTCAVEPTLDLDGALARLGSRHFDLVIADADLAGGDAASVLRSILAVEPKVKTILLSSLATPGQVIEAMGEHAFSFFSKPLDMSSVKQMVRKALELSEWEDGIDIISSDPDFLTLRLQCRIYTADRLHQFMLEMKMGMNEQECGRVAMAFREMLLNAMEHGGKLDPSEFVRVSRIRTKRTLVYHILDPGPGFSRKALAHAAVANPADDPVAHLRVREEMGMRAGGFGLLVTKQLVDEVIYNQRGNEVILIKHLD